MQITIHALSHSTVEVTMSTKYESKKIGESISEDDNSLPKIDVQYNPDIVTGLLEELQLQVDAKCHQLQKDSDFMITSLQQAFHLELIKLPTQVKSMSLRRFQDEFGDSLEAVTRGAIKGRLNDPTRGNLIDVSNLSTGNQSLQRPFQTPSGGKGTSSRILPTAMRNPKDGEKMMSMNGSPLGEFQTVVKASKQNNLLVPPTPGVFIPLESGDIIDMETMDVSALSKDHREDALLKMQTMMNNIQMAMSILEKSSHP